MTRSKRLDAVRGLEERKAEAMTRALADARRTLARNKRQLERLERYMSEYASGAVARPDAESSSLFRERRAFLQRLGQAVAQARRRVEDSGRQYDKLLASWQKQRGRTQALASASERLAREDRRQAGRKDQQDTDEVASRSGKGWPR